MSGSDPVSRFRAFAEEQFHRCFDDDKDWEQYCRERGINPYPNRIDLDKIERLKRKERHSD